MPAALSPSVRLCPFRQIEFDEFVSIMASNMLREGRGDAELDEAFAVLDRDGSSMLNLSFVRDQLMNLGSHPLSREECDSLLSEVDGLDDDGCVSMQAFKAMPCWKVPNSKQMQQAGLEAQLKEQQAKVAKLMGEVELNAAKVDEIRAGIEQQSQDIDDALAEADGPAA